ncbi:MAG: hypothetical protein CMC96_14855 [Flavobacteriales bacterium]|nr:hypothetical protein [Flavobacteriales bacterium]
MELTHIILSIEFYRGKVHVSTHEEVFFYYFLFSCFFILSWPLYITAKNFRAKWIREIYRSLIIFPLFYFLPIPIFILQLYLGINFVYGFYIYFGLSILSFILLRKRLIKWLF